MECSICYLQKGSLRSSTRVDRENHTVMLPEQGIVIDPFMGSGTTGEVAKLNNRKYINFELNPEYAILNSMRESQKSVAFLPNYEKIYLRSTKINHSKTRFC